ncbi:ABC transporter permease [Natronospora cellulosivora (SeqCode)]
MLSYIGRRFLVMIPLLILISIVSFILIQLPPGSYLETHMAALQRSGGQASQTELEMITRRYGLDQPMHVQYLRWVRGFPRGNFGQSFRQNKPVIMIIRERLGWSILISLLTVIFTWIVAVPLGIYSAVKQYSIGDHIATFFGFLGAAIPNFILALFIMFIGVRFFGTSVGGLYDSQFMGEPMSWAKFLSILGRIWIPVVVVGTGSMAGLLRIMRGQILDELRKPYVQTARAKGLSENVVLFKHVLRIAVNPIISTIGWMLPGIVSGDVIAGIVLGLPTIGPELFNALRAQEMYLAGTIVMMLSVLTLIGTLISDVLLAMVDPRIRYE